MSNIVGTIGKNTFVSAKSVGQSEIEIPQEFRTRLDQIVAKYPNGFFIVLNFSENSALEIEPRPTTEA